MKKRVYDCFMFFNELDLLEIRLNILDPHVNFFILGESTETFSGKPKPLFYAENSERFKKWHKKILHVVIPTFETNNSFERAGYQKDYLRKVLKQSPSPSPNDLVYFGDLDEIWIPQQIRNDRVYNLRQLNYSYYLNNRSSEQWVGTIVGRYKSFKDSDFNTLRATHTNELDNGGWHFSNMGGPEQIKKKLEAYDHQEYNTLENLTLIEDRMKDGEDYVGRSVDWQGKPFVFHTSEVDLPQYLLDNKEKYKHLFK